jgi:hypothetical protein
MNLKEVAIGDTILAVSEMRGVKIYGTVTQHSADGKTQLGALSFPLLGDDWKVNTVADWPEEEIRQAKTRARTYLHKVESNFADKVILEQAMDVAFNTLQEVKTERDTKPTPFWKRARR